MLSDTRRACMMTGEKLKLPPPPECFICTDTAPAPRKSACKCTDRYVHDACLVKMLETSMHPGCPVCATPYANVECRYQVVGVRAFSQGVLALVLMVLSPFLLWFACAAWRVYTLRVGTASMAEEQFVIVCAITMAIAGATGIACLGNMCVVVGPRALARSMLVQKRVASVNLRFVSSV